MIAKTGARRQTDDDDGTSSGLNDSGDERTVFILIGGVKREGEDADDKVLRLRIALRMTTARCATAWKALAGQGFDEADLDQIGVMTGPPEEEEFAEPYAGRARRRGGVHDVRERMTALVTK